MNLFATFGENKSHAFLCKESNLQSFHDYILRQKHIRINGMYDDYNHPYQSAPIYDHFDVCLDICTRETLHYNE